jgi:hypothetical protein
MRKDKLKAINSSINSILGQKYAASDLYKQSATPEHA